MTTSTKSPVDAPTQGHAAKAALRTPKTTAHLKYARGLVDGTSDAPPIAKLIGFTCAEVELGRAVMELRAGKQHANPMGTLHGGVICDVADAAIGTALATTLEDDETFTSIDLTVKFFKPIWSERVRASAWLTKRTRNLGHLECEVANESGAVIAKLYSTCMILRGEDAKGR